MFKSTHYAGGGSFCLIALFRKVPLLVVSLLPILTLFSSSTLHSECLYLLFRFILYVHLLRASFSWYRIVFSSSNRHDNQVVRTPSRLQYIGAFSQHATCPFRNLLWFMGSSSAQYRCFHFAYLNHEANFTLAQQNIKRTQIFANVIYLQI